ncbi:MAG: pyridoxal-phosphate dependent enzyme, partial [Bacteroidetes bacterium]|nr:pyridoxal-phosphate dependent enzyme [Bacteroidota bacterium]
DWMSMERINLIKSLGAEIRLVTKEEGGFLGSIRMAEELAEENERTFLPCQFTNKFNVDAHYQTTAPELWWQLKYRSLEPDAFVAGVGTGGTVMGTAKFLKEQNPNIKVHPLEPSNSPTMSTGCKVGKHRIQGISDEFIPAIVELDKLDHIVSVDDGDAIIMSQMLSQQLGLAVGISSGGNFIGALKLQNEMGAKSVVVTVFSDSNKKYLSTDLMKLEPVKETFLSKNVKLENFSALKRVCHTCCDPTDCVAFHDKNPDTITLPHCTRRGHLKNTTNQFENLKTS